MKIREGWKMMEMFVVLLVLQVCGVASIWGYSEILGWRSGYDEDWATVVIVFMSLSGFRLIASNLKPAHKWKCVTSMMDPSSSLRSNESSIFSRLMKYVGVGYSFLLDFVLQILGTASIWGYSEIAGYRKTAESKKWANVTIFFSFLSLVRYVVKFRRSYHDRDLSSHFKDPMSYWEYFEVGFVGSLSSRKMVIRSVSWMGEIHTASEIECCTGNEPSFDDSTSPYRLPPPRPLSIALFVLGFSCHLMLAVVLEALGSGGAIWGITDVWTLRTSPTSLFYRVLSVCVSVAVTLKLILEFYDNYITTKPEYSSQVPPSPSRIVQVGTETLVYQYAVPLNIGHADDDSQEEIE